MSVSTALKRLHIRVPKTTDAKDWAFKAFTKDNMFSMGVAISFVLLSGWVGFCLFRVATNYTVTG